MRVSVDFDGTLAATDQLILGLMNWRLGTAYKREDWDSWDFWRDMGPEVSKAFWGIFDLMDQSYLRRAIPPIDPFAPAVVKWLMKRGHIVHLVSANSEKARESFNGWLWAQGLDQMPIVTVNRSGTTSKAELDYDIFIDDNPKMVEEMKRFSNKTLILYSRPLNSMADTSPENVWRADDWLEVQRILEAMGA